LILKTIRFLRRNMYRNARMLGDVQAVLQGRIIHRYVQRKAGAASRRLLNRTTRGLRK
jgi:hypothetical protein